jgi:hypothetical protein
MKTQIALLFGLSLFTNLSIASDWTERYTPTKAEWLQHDLERDIRTSADLWAIRVAVNVLVFAQSKEVLILITPANGEPEMPEAVCKAYRSNAESIAKMTLEQKSWSADGKIQSKCGTYKSTKF